MSNVNESTDASKKPEQSESGGASAAENEAAGGVVAKPPAGSKAESGANPGTAAPVAVEAKPEAKTEAPNEADAVHNDENGEVSPHEDEETESSSDTSSTVSTTKGAQKAQEGQGRSPKPVSAPLKEYPYSSDEERKKLGDLESVQFVRDMRAGHIGGVNLLQKMKHAFFKKGEIVKVPLEVVQVLIDMKIAVLLDDQDEPVSREKIRLHNAQNPR